jgi:hypothetical protein
MSSQLIKKKVVAAVIAALKDKALKSNEILNQMLQRVADAAPKLFTRIF